MLTIGIVCLIIGVVLVVLAAVTPTPAPLAQLGWVALVLGIILILLSFILPLTTLHTTSALLGVLWPSP